MPVSLLELETQAEVDKYAVTVFLLADQQGGGYPAQVHARLFDRVSFDARLEPDQYRSLSNGAPLRGALSAADWNIAS